MPLRTRYGLSLVSSLVVRFHTSRRKREGQTKKRREQQRKFLRRVGLRDRNRSKRIRRQNCRETIEKSVTKFRTKFLASRLSRLCFRAIVFESRREAATLFRYQDSAAGAAQDEVSHSSRAPSTRIPRVENHFENRKGNRKKFPNTACITFRSMTIPW